MKAMILDRIFDLDEEERPLRLVEMEIPKLADNEVLIKVEACGVCHTELDEIEGRTPPLRFPVVLGHEVAGSIARKGKKVKDWAIGDRVGIGWIYSACGKCEMCKKGMENLCKDFEATGRDRNGGYAEYMKADVEFIFKIPSNLTSSEAAPLLCAGGVGYRSLKLADIKDGDVLGLTGFGASGHLVLKTVRYLYPATKIMVFARNPKERAFAKTLGAYWTGDTTDRPSEKCRAIIDTTPVWKPVVEALENLQPGGRLIINAIRKEEKDKAYLQNIDYARHLWQEKEIKSVANVTREDIRAFLELASEMNLEPEVTEYKLTEANTAIKELKNGHIKGAKVLVT